jgi:hypothetical protein
MKKLITGIVVLALANMAFAVPAFDINGGTAVVFDVNNPASMTQRIPVGASDATAMAGMELYLETAALSGQFDILNVEIGADTAWAGKIDDVQTYTNATMPGDIPINTALITIITNDTTVGTVNANPGTVAWVTIKALGNPGDTGTISTLSPTLDSGSTLFGWGAASLNATQGSTALQIVPEPVSALLLLAGLPLIRRRRA